MPLTLKPNHKSVKDYYANLEQFDKLGFKHEGAVKSAFQHVLEHCCRQVGLTLVEQFPIKRPHLHQLSVDGGLIDNFRIAHGYWEAKDSRDDLPTEIQKKFDKGYPRDNIIFQGPERAILYQDGYQVFDENIRKPEALVAVVKELFAYRTQTQADWEQAVNEFKPLIPDIAKAVVERIETERKENRRFVQAFDSFANVCRSSINPNLSDAAVEEMLVQHLLTERIFRKVFQNPDFINRNVIAHEIEKVIQALTSRAFSREEFLRDLDRFYRALEQRAETLYDYHQKQAFLNTVYEKFFQGFAVKVADTHGIVYTPQPIVDFMVKSVEEILKREFGKNLSDEGVHIIDPFVGTGNFITRIMREIKKTALPHKYSNELHCNEVMLLPYYIASMNIEHGYYEQTREYKPFEGICLVDTFELAEDRDFSGAQNLLFSEENTERVERLRNTKLFVIVGNPPYNAHQVNENDNNKNRKYRLMDRRVSDTYSRDSAATNKNALRDPYVKAIRWASDKVRENGEGIVAFVSNGSFVSDFAFDGMRRHLGNDFNLTYIVDLKGNIRKDSMRDGIPLGEKHTVFGLAAMVGVCISFFIKKNSGDHKLFYSETDFRATRPEKFRILDDAGHIYGLQSRQLESDRKHSWLTEGLRLEFEDFMPLGTKATKAGVGNAAFRTFSPGVKTNRDPWVYSFNPEELASNVKRMIDAYNEQVRNWQVCVDIPGNREEARRFLDSFVLKDDTRIGWSRDLKLDVLRGKIAHFSPSRIRPAMYRPFAKTHLYFDRTLNEEVYQMPFVFPPLAAESENRAICVASYGRKTFAALMVDCPPDVNFYGDPHQALPFYTYDEDGSNRRDNITNWGVEQLSAALNANVDKWQIFYYIYGLLHSPEYRERYKANLKRELPRIPLPKTIDYFHSFVSAGERLADLHVNYESQAEYPLEKIETPGKPLDWRVRKMKLTKDKTAIVYNDFLTLAGVPPKTFEYRLGNRSALDWIIDRYQVRVDKRSGIVNDPYRADDPEYIVRLIGKVITVSLETVKIVDSLPNI